jgi:hypothetical protein
MRKKFSAALVHASQSVDGQWVEGCSGKRILNAGCAEGWEVCAGWGYGGKVIDWVGAETGDAVFGLGL